MLSVSSILFKLKKFKLPLLQTKNLKLRLSTLSLAIAMAFLMNGCASKIVYVKCDFKPVPEKPLKADYSNYQEYLKAILIYTYELESLKEYCLD